MSLTKLKQFPERLRTEWKEHSLEIYAINILRFRYVRANSIKLAKLASLIRLASLALKALRAIIVDLKKEELLVKKPVEEPKFASVPNLTEHWIKNF